MGYYYLDDSFQEYDLCLDHPDQLQKFDIMADNLPKSLISEMTRLTSLKINSDDTITESVLSRLNCLSFLKIHTTAGFGILDICKLNLQVLILEADDLGIIDNNLHMISKIKSLTTLKLHNCTHVTRRGLCYLSKLVNLNLTKLFMKLNKCITDEDLSVLTDKRVLKSLHIEHFKLLTELCLEYIKYIPKLKITFHKKSTFKYII